MTNKELSDSMDVLLNSYDTSAQFGEQASRREIILDEYEKSVLLTQAQDIILKSYFDARLNPQGEGFDDGTRRQVDFSSLIKVATLDILPNTKTITVKSVDIDWFDTGNTIEVTAQTDEVTNILIEVTNGSTLTFGKPLQNTVHLMIPIGVYNMFFTWSAFMQALASLKATVGGVETSLSTYFTFRYLGTNISLPTISDAGEAYNGEVKSEKEVPNDVVPFDDRGIIYQMPVNSKGITDVLFILNEQVVIDNNKYVVVPINYKEYDRMMSKAYSQPHKKQMWRLFQNLNTEFDVQSELIPKEQISSSVARKKIKYKIRYVKRPKPIILENLPNGLEIDGESEESPCELNPILHRDILNKAVELAIATRGGGTARQPQSQQQQ